VDDKERRAIIARLKQRGIFPAGDSEPTAEDNHLANELFGPLDAGPSPAASGPSPAASDPPPAASGPAPAASATAAPAAPAATTSGDVGAGAGVSSQPANRRRPIEKRTTRSKQAEDDKAISAELVKKTEELYAKQLAALREERAKKESALLDGEEIEDDDEVIILQPESPEPDVSGGENNGDLGTDGGDFDAEKGIKRGPGWAKRDITDADFALIADKRPLLMDKNVPESAISGPENGISGPENGDILPENGGKAADSLITQEQLAHLERVLERGEALMRWQDERIARNDALLDIVNPDHLYPWDRIETETDEEWAAFKIYRDLMPIMRSLSETSRQYIENCKKAGADSSLFPMSINKLQRTYVINRWEDRVRAYDTYQDKLEQKKWIERRLRQREEEWGMREKLIERAEQMLRFPLAQVTQESRDGKVIQHFYPVRWKMGDMSSLVKLAMRLGRDAANMGDGNSYVSVDEIDEQIAGELARLASADQGEVFASFAREIERGDDE